MRRFLLLLAAFPLVLSAQSFPSLDKTIQLAKERALRSSNVDWPTVESEAHSTAIKEGEDAAIRRVVNALGDHHSSYIRSAPIAEPEGQVAGVSVLAINSWKGSADATQMATKDVRSAVANAVSNSQCGIILDFAQNSGGNMWPMLVGLSPLLTDGRLGGFRDSTGKTSLIEKKNGTIYVNGAPHPAGETIGVTADNALKAIAIVVGPSTSSSGEITPLMFKGQSNVRFFGQPTSGHSTANSTIALPNGGVLNLTTAVTVDRTGQAYDGKVTPDTLSDQPMTDAATWVISQCRK